MRRILKIVLATLGVAIGLAILLALWGLPQTKPARPHLDGRIEPGAIQHDGRTRSWIAYVPARLAPDPALVIVLHGSMGSGQGAREAFGYDFDLLADEHRFIVVYPQGYGGEWNECKVRGPYQAKREHVDDVGFLHAMVDHLASVYRTSPSRVYVTGVSNGGSMTLRLAIETPDFARAYAVVVSSVPTPENMAPVPKKQPVSILLMNGTKDPFNPWRGGDVALYGIWGNRGPVLSTQQSIDYFRALDGLSGTPEVTRLPDLDPSDGSTVERSSWFEPGKSQVVLYTIKGGGHAVPHPGIYGRRLLGHANRDIHAAREIWSFFASQARR